MCRWLHSAGNAFLLTACMMTQNRSWLRLQTFRASDIIRRSDACYWRQTDWGTYLQKNFILSKVLFSLVIWWNYLLKLNLLYNNEKEKLKENVDAIVQCLLFPVEKNIYIPIHCVAVSGALLWMKPLEFC